MSLSGERGTLAVSRFVQQSRGAALVLSAGDAAQLTAAADAIAVEGARYPKHIEKTTGL